MPEYLAPGVYIEETSFRAKTIEGVSTSTAGFIGPAAFGPIDGVPELITSFSGFERVYGGAEQLQFSGEDTPTHNYLAHAVRGFFENGGQRLYVMRAWNAPEGEDYATQTVTAAGSLPLSGNSLTLRARYPGSGGDLKVTLTLRISQNVLASQLQPDGSTRTVLRGVSPYDVVLVSAVGSLPGIPAAGVLHWAERRFDTASGQTNWILHAQDGSTLDVSTRDPATEAVFVVRVNVEVVFPGESRRTETWQDLGFHPAQRTSLSKTFGAELASKSAELTNPLVITASSSSMEGPEIAGLLFDAGGLIAPGDDGRQAAFELSGGGDGARPAPANYAGTDIDPKRKTGLKAFEDLADISIVAAPGSTYGGETAFKTNALLAMGHLISHCSAMKSRIAVLDSADQQSLQQVLAMRSQHDSTHAALYYPWLRILDPVTQEEILIPPSGHVAGIYARNDIERGVHKAPANEVVRGVIGFEVMLNKAQQDVLNPQGVNCFRWLEGRGNRLFAARTISSDPEWKYVNLRRYFAYLERSIERGTQWAVFENNGPTLWGIVQRTIEDFLFNEWKNDRLMGRQPQEAYFVRCDETTMSQNDIDNGRLICLIGVAPLRPAEFVIFRIGQWVGMKLG